MAMVGFNDSVVQFLQFSKTISFILVQVVNELVQIFHFVVYSNPDSCFDLSKGLFQGKPKGIQLSNIIVLITLSPIVNIVLANIYNLVHKIQ